MIPRIEGYDLIRIYLTLLTHTPPIPLCILNPKGEGGEVRSYRGAGVREGSWGERVGAAWVGGAGWVGVG
jgi:hypothetical protein